MDFTELNRKLGNLYKNELSVTKEIMELERKRDKVRAARDVLKGVYDNIFAAMANNRSDVVLKVTAMTPEEAKQPDKVKYHHANLLRILEGTIPFHIFIDTPDNFKKACPELYDKRVATEKVTCDTVIYFSMKSDDGAASSSSSTQVVDDDKGKGKEDE